MIFQDSLAKVVPEDQSEDYLLAIDKSLVHHSEKNCSHKITKMLSPPPNIPSEVFPYSYTENAITSYVAAVFLCNNV